MRDETHGVLAMTQKRDGGRRRRGAAGPRPGGVLRRLRDSGHGAPRKALGQHFLEDPRILAAIADAAGLGPEDAVLEIGTGPGTLTRVLCERARRVLSFEIDARMLAFAAAELGERAGLELVHADALAGGRLSPELQARVAGESALKWVSNLPYQIATPLVIEVFRSLPQVALAVVMVQREVAERLVARPGSRDYGPATLLLGVWAEAEILRRVPPGAFRPPPAVESALLRLLRRREPMVAPVDFPAFADFAKAVFSQRRKQIGVALKRLSGGANAALNALSSLRLDPRQRAEELPLAAFHQLFLASREFLTQTPSKKL